MEDNNIKPFLDEEEEIEFVEHMILMYLKKQMDLGRAAINLSEIYEFLGSDFDGEDLELRLTEMGENVISLWDAKRKQKLH
jgi:hypothetical protein